MQKCYKKHNKAYQELGGHDTDSQTLSKEERELMKLIDRTIDSVE